MAIPCVYKPVRGERPLWDFPDGTLADREVASHRISEAAGWNCVPPTILRDGPYGSGMVQQWISDADPDLTADLVPETELPDGWFPILRAVDEDGAGLLLVHAPLEALAVLAGFDLVVNNADRKASHILPTPDDRIRGVDHGGHPARGRQAADHPLGLGRRPVAGARARRAGTADGPTAGR